MRKVCIPLYTQNALISAESTLQLGRTSHQILSDSCPLVSHLLYGERQWAVLFL